MNKENIQQMQQKLIQYYQHLNRWWCWLFAYAFVSRIGWEWLRLSNTLWEANTNNWQIWKNLSAEHFVVEFDWMVFDWHEFWTIIWETVTIWWSTLRITNRRWKENLLLAVFEWWRNPTFYKSKIWNNNWDVLRTFLCDFESILDQIWVKYSSRIS